MNRTDFTNILSQPKDLNEQQLATLKLLVEEYPFFQSARVIYLKGLKQQNSYLYNQELKKTAAYTSDRSILFDFITSENFNQGKTTQNSELEKIQEHSDTITKQETITKTTVHVFFPEPLEEITKKVLDPDLFETKRDNYDAEIVQIKEQLEIGKPLEFNKSETHSFQEWLKLTQIKPIEREEGNKHLNETNDTVTKDSNSKEPEDKRQQKFNLIDKFIAENPKIKPSKKTVSLKNLSIENSYSSDELMTETLAKVYLEQKNYKKAIQAYRILSLKYPEKSSFFADRISDIEKIEINTK